MQANGRKQFLFSLVARRCPGHISPWLLRCRQLFGKKLKAFCDFAGYTYNPRDITGQEKDGERWRERTEGKIQLFIYLRSTDKAPCVRVSDETLQIPF